MSNKYEDLIKNARVNADCGEHMSPSEVTTLLNVVETTFAALAAENAGLKGAFSKPDAWLSWHSIPPTFYEPDRGGEYLQVHEKAGEKNDDGSDSWPVYSKPEIETPATDAFLAEVRAQGVEMFASKCKEESKRAHSSDARDSWWVSGENAEDFADELRKGVLS